MLRWLVLPVAAGLLYGMGLAVWGQMAFSHGLSQYATNPILSHHYTQIAVHRWPYDKRQRFHLIYAAVRSGVDEKGMKQAEAAAYSAYPGHPFVLRIIAQEFTSK